MIAMIMKWLRDNVYAAGLLFLVRVYLGWQWLTSGWGKLTGDKPFSAEGFIKRIVDNPVQSHDEAVYPTYNAFIEGFALPNAKLFSIMVAWGEFLVGLGLVLGCLTTGAVFFGLIMNFMFMFGGTVSSNPWMILLGFIILAAGANAGKFGADYYALPYLRKLFAKYKKGRKNETMGLQSS
jgi:thiosulfate dehydrogenase [quinone] large subunit